MSGIENPKGPSAQDKMEEAFDFKAEPMSPDFLNELSAGMPKVDNNKYTEVLKAGKDALRAAVKSNPNKHQAVPLTYDGNEFRVVYDAHQKKFSVYGDVAEGGKEALSEADRLAVEVANDELNPGWEKVSSSDPKVRQLIKREKRKGFGQPGQWFSIPFKGDHYAAYVKTKNDIAVFRGTKKGSKPKSKPKQEEIALDLSGM